MELNDYQSLALRTHGGHVTKHLALSNYALGLTGEAGEVADLIKKHIFHGHELEREAIVKELGDVLWYLSSLAHVCDITLDEVAEQNIEKLTKRYPNGFNYHDSIYRTEQNE
ncbi:nucleoside triphosphate pyrophosphohydrolase family protein [Staphylococcus sp. 17KM0847]|uniref:nucleoside triphosphate pyrophosphohydrolase family protein n=1 Tax=Staphylococcus sp. 17KM0847 TaxID=2583989 RepID=UPI0015DD193A|nr:nucleoside triphosphate pyrophosphohydrolase family protein [Staphylococcus sp. 17KM0847]QLK85585.1 nucleotide pyrophosphohydrolase [Staphylococcus sp. 17KM0847]